MSTHGMVQATFEAADRGIAAAGPDSHAARRLAKMHDFYAFMFREMPAVIDRWRAQREG